MPNNLKSIRTQKGMSQLQLRVLAECGPNTITAIEKYDDCPKDAEVRQRLANALSVTEQAIWPHLASNTTPLSEEPTQEPTPEGTEIPA